MAADRITQPRLPSEACIDNGAAKDVAIDVWLIDTNSIDQSRYNGLLDRTEQTRATNIQNLQMRDQYICTRIFSRLILGYWLGIDPQKISFSYETSRPVCLNEGAPIFSLSKRENWIAMAVSVNPIGVDVEKIDHQVADQYVIEELFSSSERALLSKLNKRDRTLAYFSMWSQKEAYSKATGHGTELDFAKIQTSPEGGPIEDLSDNSFHLALYGHSLSDAGPQNYVVSLATPLASPVIKLGDTLP